MLAASVSLFDRQLVFVTGEGWTGRTTVAAAIGLAAARRRRRGERLVTDDVRALSERLAFGGG